MVEQSGWQTRGQELTAIGGVGCHHTASPPSSTLATNLHVVTNGNGVAPGPIANVLLWRDGTCHVVASGRSNHAGAGGPWGWLPVSPSGVLSIANARSIGIEAVNSGVGEVWAPQMLDAYEIMVAAFLLHIGQPASHAFMHSEWAPTRKIDPAGPNGRYPYIRGMTWSGDAFRAAVSARMNPEPPVESHPPVPPITPTPSEEDDMPRQVRVQGDIAVLNVDGLIATWTQDPTVQAAAVAAGLVSSTVGIVDRKALKILELHGPAPVYAWEGVHPDWPSKTSPADFARHVV